MMHWKDSARSAFQTLMAHQLNQQSAIVRAGQAKGTGLDPERWVSPFTTASFTDNRRQSSLLPVLLGSALTAGLLGGGLWLGSLLSAGKVQPASPTETIIDNTQDVGIGVKTRWEPAE